METTQHLFLTSRKTGYVSNDNCHINGRQASEAHEDGVLTFLGLATQLIYNRYLTDDAQLIFRRPSAAVQEWKANGKWKLNVRWGVGDVLIGVSVILQLLFLLH